MSMGQLPGGGMPPPANQNPQQAKALPGSEAGDPGAGLAKRKFQLLGQALKAWGAEMEKDDPDPVKFAQARMKVVQLMRFGQKDNGPQDVQRAPERPRQVDRPVDAITGQPPQGSPERPF